MVVCWTLAVAQDMSAPSWLMLKRWTKVTGLDIAQGMIDYAQSCHHSSKLNWQLGDAQQLPLALPDHASTYDLVTSSLAIQWCKNLDAVFAGVAQCLDRRWHFSLRYPGATNLAPT